MKQKLFPSKEALMPDQHLLRFLRARDFDLGKTTDMLTDYLEWAREFENVTFHRSDFPSIMKFAGTGALYRAGFDKEGRPIIVVQASKIFPREVEDVQEIARYWVAYVDYLNNECEKAGSTDYTAIADLAGFNPSKNFSLALMKVLIDILQKYYPERLAYALVLNAPFAFRMIWNMIKPFLEERTQAKVTILGSDYKKLLNYVAADTLETTFGGKHAPYPLPDHIASLFDTEEGYTVHTGYFGDVATDHTPAEAAEAAKANGKHKLKKGMSSTRVMRVRGMLAKMSSMRALGAPTAIEVPKSSPRVTVFGATGRTGMLVVGLALKAGYDVCAFVRIDGKGVPPALLAMGKEFGEDKLQIVVGDVTNASDLDRAIETSDAVVSCMGAPLSMQTGANEFYMTTGSKIVESMERNGTKRFVVVTAAQVSQAWWDSNASLTENISRPLYWAGALLSSYLPAYIPA